MLVTVNKIKRMACRGPHTSQITTSGIFATEVFQFVQ